MFSSKLYRNSWNDEIFYYFYRFASIGPTESIFLLTMGIVPMIYRFLKKEGEFSSNDITYMMSMQQQQHHQYYSDNNFNPRLPTSIDLIAHLFCACNIKFKKCPPTATFGRLDDLIEYRLVDWEKIMLNEAFFSKVIKKDMNVEAVFRIAKHHCWDSIENTSLWFTFIKQNLTQELKIDHYPSSSNGISELMRLYFILLLELLDLNDECSDLRIELGFNTLLGFFKINRDKAILFYDHMCDNNLKFKTFCTKKDSKNKLQAVLNERKRVVIDDKTVFTEHRYPPYGN